jgi:mannose-6-phosphate isomerase-like protein (cupin superfamily)
MLAGMAVDFGFALDPGGGERVVIGERTLFIRASRDLTGGAFTLFDFVPPVADMALHVHAKEDELWYVIEGEHVFTVGEEDFHVGPGAVVFAPRGIPHGHRRVVPGAGRLLALTWPAGYEDFVRDVAEADAAGALTEMLAGISERHGIAWV